jgi:hypothetical protein
MVVLVVCMRVRLWVLTRLRCHYERNDVRMVVSLCVRVCVCACTRVRACVRACAKPDGRRQSIGRIVVGR